MVLQGVSQGAIAPVKIYTLIAAGQMTLPPGAVLRMPATWQDYCTLSDSRGDGSIPRMKYRNGEMLLMSPLPRHGREANILADIVKILLDSEARNYEAFTPITMTLPEVGGIEPDYCFYIDNWQSAVGKDRINWQTDPPPDLVIEIDVTTYSAAADYLIYRVPEVWLFKVSGLQIHGLQPDGYTLQSYSRYFPDLDLAALVADVLETSASQGTGAALRSLRQQFRQ